MTVHLPSPVAVVVAIIEVLVREYPDDRVIVVPSLDFDGAADGALVLAIRTEREA